MDSVLDQIGEWLKELLVSGILNQLTGLFDSVNTQVGDIATQVGTTPANFSPGVFAMIRNVSESVIIPVSYTHLDVYKRQPPAWENRHTAYKSPTNRPETRRRKLHILRFPASGKAHSFRCFSSPRKARRLCGGPKCAAACGH